MTQPPIKARPTIYRGMQMRSRLEADYAASLDRSGQTWDYEPVCYASQHGQWLPDFAVRWAGISQLIELKPAGLLTDMPGTAAYEATIDKLLTRMTIAWHTDPDLSLCLVFWHYGGPASVTFRSLSLGHPWAAEYDGQPAPLLWTGMGQRAALTTSTQPLTMPPSPASTAMPNYTSLIAAQWPAIVGPELAAHTEPGSLVNGELTIYTDSTAWATQVRLLSRQLRDRINSELGPDVITSVNARRSVAR